MRDGNERKQRPERHDADASEPQAYEDAWYRALKAKSDQRAAAARAASNEPRPTQTSD